MELNGKVVVVTGGASGIGQAMCRRFAQEGARAVVVADLQDEAAQQLAREIGGLAVRTNVAVQAEVQALVERATQSYGQIDLFCSNAGIISRTDSDAPPADWQRHWDVNLMAHVHAANAVLPQMLARGEGYLLQTASAAGLLSQVNAAPYTVTKHAAAAFAEWLSIAHGDAGIRVSCLCPQGVLTPMLLGAAKGGRRSFLQEGAVTPEALAEVVVQGLRAERFLILPHEEVLDFWQRKTADIDRWLKGMRRLRAKVMGADA
ncbi:MAG: SDR family oxidoreductase [Ideonella sp.]|jgi:NAD(P)-dependent dehydrogenase (short-subunit alcohol dehydrogenase family)|nr:SDR family oxidoreductase [Ideonella sp.]MBL0147411.1 SDR family oxidoreductase [Ideonella sp.]